MQLQLNKEEKQMFENLTRSADGLVLREFIEKIIRQIESVRTQTTLSNEARIEIGNWLEQNFIDRFKVIKGEKTGDEEDYH